MEPGQRVLWRRVLVAGASASEYKEMRFRKLGQKVASRWLERACDELGRWARESPSTSYLVPHTSSCQYEQLPTAVASAAPSWAPALGKGHEICRAEQDSHQLEERGPRRSCFFEHQYPLFRPRPLCPQRRKQVARFAGLARGCLGLRHQLRSRQPHHQGDILGAPHGLIVCLCPWRRLPRRAATDVPWSCDSRPSP